MHDARNSYTQYVPIGYRLLRRYLDKAYNSVPGGVGSNPPHGISNKDHELSEVRICRRKELAATV
jgi:hypothetical protein